VTVTLDIPDEIARELAVAGQELSRAALEALALEGYRRGALSQLHVTIEDLAGAMRAVPGLLKGSLQRVSDREMAAIKAAVESVPRAGAES